MTLLAAAAGVTPLLVRALLVAGLLLTIVSLCGKSLFSGLTRARQLVTDTFYGDAAAPSPASEAPMSADMPADMSTRSGDTLDPSDPLADVAPQHRGLIWQLQARQDQPQP